MRNLSIKNFLLIALMFFLTACSGFFDKDNTPDPKPLSHFTPEIKPVRLWSARAGSGIGDDYLKMSPGIGETAIFTASASGAVTSIDKTSGRKNWQVYTRYPLTTGPGVGNGIIVVGSRQGDVIALQQANGQERWRTTVPGAIFATPAVDRDMVIIKTIDGYTRALSATDGSERWSFQQVEPNLILRGSSAPLIQDRSVIVGYANGNLAKLTLGDGQLLWMQPIAIPEGAFAIQRMIDIDADPVVFEHRIYAATYQGKIASLDWGSGRTLWTHDISSYTGMTADANAIYISDAKSYIWSFNAESGGVNWRQTDLEHRGVTGPATLRNYIIVGDSKGFLHWLDKRDGRFVARDYVGAMNAAPIVENNVLYVLTNSGYLVAYTLS
ncbi:outer membrane protein assembly factor BamB [Aquicella lusitana]|uniref:Outer membrane protein assembly factor BamB n=1 Tax=Aquicella lusitana TaxID=254246 RepID=A0A370GS93_9COXI|nr:outer membrane protein assembly factor BamB [Aquicella lusitana]RDI44803.1 Beta-barrel assembly machine subunit BamB [Aquicella lusitana]VVC73000.1 Outer membrane protein assembly factor BamB [Aquicella lusitana]